MHATLLDILQPLGNLTEFTYAMEGSHPTISAELTTLSGEAIMYLAHLVDTTDLFVEVRNGNLIIREMIA